MNVTEYEKQMQTKTGAFHIIELKIAWHPYDMDQALWAFLCMATSVP